MIQNLFFKKGFLKNCSDLGSNERNREFANLELQGCGWERTNNFLRPREKFETKHHFKQFSK